MNYENGTAGSFTVKLWGRQRGVERKETAAPIFKKRMLWVTKLCQFKNLKLITGNRNHQPDGAPLSVRGREMGTPDITEPISS